jgi:EAL domain-containing protein (putative c-di-GMP-specific phosphodiesterase class I)
LIAADDFGVEHSNFARLLAIDLDFIKIDRAFVHNLASDRRSEMIVRNLVKFAHSIGAKTVAEYVSTREIYELVRDIGVDYSQGFFFGKPQPLIAENNGE